MTKNISLTVIENGPIKVSGKATFQYCGDPMATKEGEDVYLCRCGLSSNAPFCDGSHSKQGFVAEPPKAGKKSIAVWEGKTLRTFFNPNTCMHVFYCKPLKELRKQELAGDAEAAKKIAEVVQSCPSGALTYESREPIDCEAPQGADIDIIEGGEIRVQCNFEINEDLQEKQPSDRATLCRCGLSENKPWCDGRHKKRENFK